ncbi:toll-like receptor Tollo [Patiria miniata]|uniref:TIR domain-containing protein n=1 Tax=Patiria miniata TaxID=46514 RepID=A0A913Z7B7_PATMI|nr:toll-like receptor Tollo [Patiria miniata]
MASLVVSLLILVWFLEPSTLGSASPLDHQSLCDIDACECEFEYNQTAVTCKVLYAGFDFTNLRSVSQVPSGPWTLKFQAALYNGFGTPSANGSWYPLAIPSTVFPSLDEASLPKFKLVIEGVNLISVANGAFSGLALDSVEFSDVRMTDLPLDSFLDQSASLKRIRVFKVLQLNDTSIRPPMFHSFQALEEIEIDHVQLPFQYLRNHSFYNLPSLNYVRLIYSPLAAISPNAFDGVPNLAFLELSNCELQRVPTALLSKLDNLTLLNLAWNNIKNVGPADVEAVKQAPSLFTFIVIENPFSCTCELLEFVNLLNDDIILDFMGWYGYLYDASRDAFGIGKPRPGYHCASPVQTFGKSLLDFSLVEYLKSNCDLRSTAQPVNNVSPPRQDFVDSSTVKRLAVSIISALVALGIVVVAVAVILHRKIKIRWVGLFRRYERQYDVLNEVNHEEYTYDAYICHHEDMDIFIAEKMIPRLEEEPNNFRLCLSFRDFLVGADKLDNVATAMANSRLVIALLDANFIASGQCMLELNMACSRMLEAGVGAYPAAAEAIPPHAPAQGTTSLLLVLLDALPVDALPGTVAALRDKITCLEWKENEEERCWQQLSTSIQAVRPQAIQQVDIAENT